MRSEKGITLVALIGIFVLIVVLAGISISIAAKGNNQEQEPAKNVSTVEEQDEYEELVVDPTKVVKNETENVIDTNTVTNVVE